MKNLSHRRNPCIFHDSTEMRESAFKDIRWNVKKKMEQHELLMSENFCYPSWSFLVKALQETKA